ncbi:hypothetical protein BU23DRAFT_100416 [Bimuria novae-zelandiae CBS 107.79]|uniref:Uncharacterized protein n=1 Tax=Bimuria novae-zelandiae CBS 107.79 TaxID=1447943 RepID=A0A6A5VUZ1_9PLEO|nr:hypothetical protein BU23DRAFT_100416 [Bimuria novae-zelandiae CBS 107.79]
MRTKNAHHNAMAVAIVGAGLGFVLLVIKGMKMEVLTMCCYSVAFTIRNWQRIRASNPRCARERSRKDESKRRAVEEENGMSWADTPGML